MFFNDPFSQIPTFFSLFFFLFMVIFVIAIIRSISEWHQNNQSPRLTVEAKIVDKHTHTDVQHHHTGNQAALHTTSSTTYYVTFEVESGDRLVFKVQRTQYSLLAKGDQGKLQFQGSRFLGFERLS